MSSSGHGIIGGLFGLEPAIMERGLGTPPFAGSCLSYFLNVRCALLALCESVKPKLAWLPSYLCCAILDPFRNLGVPVRFYNVGSNLETGEGVWTEDVEKGDLVLMIHYFGFPNRTFPFAELKRQGAVVVEDASQGLFVKQVCPESTCIVYSPRKFLGVPDGGIMASLHNNGIALRNLEPPPIEWWKNALTTAQMRREFDLVGGENVWFPLFRHVEEAFPLGPYRSSELAKMLIETSTDYELIRIKRRQNYLALLDQLRAFALFPDLDAETVPLGFPVCVEAARRDSVLEHLYGKRIYPPIHWHIKDIVPGEHKDSHLLSRRILTLVCDQRYTISDMMRQADAFQSAVD